MANMWCQETLRHVSLISGDMANMWCQETLRHVSLLVRVAADNPSTLSCMIRRARPTAWKPRLALLEGFFLALWLGSIRIRSAGEIFGFPRLVYSPRYSRGGRQGCRLPSPIPPMSHCRVPTSGIFKSMIPEPLPICNWFSSNRSDQKHFIKFCNVQQNSSYHRKLYKKPVDVNIVTDQPSGLVSWLLKRVKPTKQTWMSLQKYSAPLIDTKKFAFTVQNDRTRH